MSKRKFFKKLTALALCLCSVTAVSACGGGGENSSATSISSEMKGVTMSVSVAEQPASLVTDAVKMYLSADSERLVTEFLPAGNYRDDQGVPLLLECDFTMQENAPAVKQVTAEFSFTEDFSVIEQTTTFRGKARKLRIYNLQTSGKTYFYRVTATLEDGNTVVETGTVQIEPSPRMLYLDGGSNARDIGGWKTQDGKTVKQGVLYRGGEIDGGKNKGHPDFCLTETGLEQLRALGIKTDFDLRSSSVKVSEYSALGADVTRNFYDAAQYEAILNSSNAERTRRIFSDLANPEAYPAYLHCTHGVDRAGSTVLILQALLGVEKADLIREYELSAFYYNYRHVNRNTNTGGTVLNLLQGLEEYQGETLADKTAKFLLSIGVTQEEIDTLRNIFLE
jgi:protein tyrosine/serine phosphatase